MSSLKINDVDTVDRRVNFCWPKADTRVPESQRKKPVIEGHVDCKFAYHSQSDAERLDADVEAGDLSSNERFELLVPEINGLPVTEGERPHDWLSKHRYGGVIRQAIWEDYLTFMAEGRQGNSKKRR